LLLDDVPSPSGWTGGRRRTPRWARSAAMVSSCSSSDWSRWPAA